MNSESRPDRQRPTVRASGATAWPGSYPRPPAPAEVDRERTRRQIDGLSGAASRQRALQIVEQLRRRQQAAPTEHARPFDIYRVPGTGSPGSFVLMARGQLVVRTDTSETRHREAGPAGASRRTRSDTAVLRDLGYLPAGGPAVPQARRSRHAATPADDRIQLFVSGKDADGVIEDVQLLRSQDITAAPNLIVPLGYLIKGDDYPYATSGFPAMSPGTPTRRVRVAVVDTGMGPRRGDGWLAGVTATADDHDLLDVVPEHGRLDWFSGHGTFAAGIVQQTAPRAEIAMYRCTHGDGLATEADVANGLLRAAQEGAEAGLPTIVNVSLGTPAIPGVPLVALCSAIERIVAEYPDVLIVAAAGNMGSDTEVYPAAFDGVVAVGAVEVCGPDDDEQLRPASFSNYGPWVDCSTVGVGVVSTFVPGLQPPQQVPGHPDQLFGADPVASWSGTSFAAPQISGAVARLLDDDPTLGTPRAAFEALIAGRDTIAGYGAILRILPGTPMP